MDLKFNNKIVLIKIVKMPVRKSLALKNKKKQAILKIIQTDILKETKTIMETSKWISMKKIEEGLYKITIPASTHKMINKDNQEIMKMVSMNHRCMKKNIRLATCILADHYFHHFIITYIFFLCDPTGWMTSWFTIRKWPDIWNLFQAISVYLLRWR